MSRECPGQPPRLSTSPCDPATLRAVPVTAARHGRGRDGAAPRGRGPGVVRQRPGPSHVLVRVPAMGARVVGPGAGGGARRPRLLTAGEGRGNGTVGAHSGWRRERLAPGPRPPLVWLPRPRSAAKGPWCSFPSLPRGSGPCKTGTARHPRPRLRTRNSSATPRHRRATLRHRGSTGDTLAPPRPFRSSHAAHGQENARLSTSLKAEVLGYRRGRRRGAQESSRGGSIGKVTFACLAAGESSPLSPRGAGSRSKCAQRCQPSTCLECCGREHAGGSTREGARQALCAWSQLEPVGKSSVGLQRSPGPARHDALRHLRLG